MKKLLFILLSLLPLTAFSQGTKTVAVLDPICRDNSVNVFFQQIVRGTMESAVSSTDEFIAYDRTAFDKIMQEQKFQRSGAVNDSQIKRLGELAGVDYVLVTEVSAYESYMNVIVKILNVETGQSSKSRSVLMELTPPSVQNSCQELAQQVFGIVDVNTGLRKGELLLEEGRYIGEIKNGKPHGRGKLVYKDSNTYYEGDWVDGIRQGYGIIVGNGEKYEGNFDNGTYNGDGTYYLNNGNKYVGNWKDGEMSGQGTAYYADGKIYEGNFENGSMNGYGTLYFPNGDKYVGNWKDGKMSGKGTFYFADGEKYERDFGDGINDYGTYYYADGSKYVGYFKDGQKDGKGILYYTEGHAEGYWTDDRANGLFTKYGKDGSVEKGNYVNGKSDGEWIKIDAKGKQMKATFSNGEIIRDWH